MIDPITWTAIGAAAALVSAAFAAVYTYLTYRLVRTQGEPNVVVYVRHDDARRSIIQIVVENIGRGLASDIRFKPSRPIPSRAFGIAFEDAQGGDPMTEGPLVDGIRALGPGDSRKITWGQFGGLLKALGHGAIELECTYKHGNREIGPTMFLLDVKSFNATDATESEAARVIHQLERIAKAIEQKSK
jgi:hypothetical protein